MAVERQTVATRILTGGPDGRLLPAISGNETDDELRHMALHLAERCPLDQKHLRCPFRMLNGLTLDSLRTLVNEMNRRSLLALFEMECDCRNHWLAPSLENL